MIIAEQIVFVGLLTSLIDNAHFTFLSFVVQFIEGIDLLVGLEDKASPSRPMINLSPTHFGITDRFIRMNSWEMFLIEKNLKNVVFVAARHRHRDIMITTRNTNQTKTSRQRSQPMFNLPNQCARSTQTVVLAARRVLLVAVGFAVEISKRDNEETFLFEFSTVIGVKLDGTASIDGKRSLDTLTWS